MEVMFLVKWKILQIVLLCLMISFLIIAFIDLENIKTFLIGMSIVLLGIILIINLNTKNTHK